ncbi:MAG: TolC family protein [Chitinophagales bacterium]
MKQVETEINNLEKEFQLLLNTEELVTTGDTLSVPVFTTSTDNSLNIWLNQSKQNIAIEQAKVDVLKADLKPSFSIGYAAQKYFEGGWLSGVQGGVSIPLFNGQTKKRITAQRIEIEIANYQYEGKALAIDQQLLKAQNAILLYYEGVSFYKDQLQTINPEIVRITQLNYKAGEISYLELLNTLS